MFTENLRIKNNISVRDGGVTASVGQGIENCCGATPSGINKLMFHFVN